MSTRRSSALTATVAVAAFVALGMPRAAFGVAWPSVAGDLNRDIADLGTAVTVFVAGYLAGTFTVGRMVGKLGTGATLVTGAALASAAIVGYAVAGTWVFLLASAATLGVGGGWLDAGMNAHVALHRGARVMGWLHAGFGVGSALGPLMITTLLAAGAGWRIGFWVMAALQALIVAALAATFRSWDGTAARPPRGRVRLQPVVMLTLLVFLFYVGVEGAVAQWAFTFLTEGRTFSDATAGLAVTGFWVALTGARVLLGVAGNRMNPARVAGFAAAAALGSALLLWWSPASWMDPAALVCMGAALGPIFPLQTLLTPRRVGTEATTAMVGYQMAAASVGAMLIPGGLGPLVAHFGVRVVAPVLVAGSGALAAVTVAARRARAD